MSRMIIGPSIVRDALPYEARALLNQRHKVTVLSKVNSFHVVRSTHRVAVGGRSRKDIS